MIQEYGVGLSQYMLCLYNWKEIGTCYCHLKVLVLKNSGFCVGADKWKLELKVWNNHIYIGMIQEYGVGLSQYMLCLYNWMEIGTYYCNLKVVALKNSEFYVGADRWKLELKVWKNHIYIGMI